MHLGAGPSVTTDRYRGDLPWRELAQQIVLKKAAVEG
jgi:hypothetical protein